MRVCTEDQIGELKEVGQLRQDKPESVGVFVCVYVVWVSAGLSLSLLSVIGGFTYGLPLGVLTAVLGMLAAQFVALGIFRAPCGGCGWGGGGGGGCARVLSADASSWRA